MAAIPSWQYILIHHSAGPDHPELMSFDDIKKYHVEENRWQDIGYHAVAERIEGVPVVLFGRGIHMQGAHCPGMNLKALGICFVGNYEERAIDEELIDEAIRRFIVPMCITFNIPPSRIYGHRDYRHTLCPGENLYRHIPAIRVKVSEMLDKWRRS